MDNKLIISFKGERYSFDQDTERIFKDGKVLLSSQASPVYSYLGDKNNPPKFSGILLKDINSILTLNGKINPIIDINTIK